MSGSVLIYGGSGGIGAAIARALVARGQRVHLVARDQGRLALLSDELGASFTAGDVGDEALFIRATEAAGERLSGLVYAVGTIDLKSLPRVAGSDILHDFRINALGAALAIQSALPALKLAEPPASVVLFSTIAATQGFAFHTSIAMAKGAVEGLTRSLAAELAPGIRVNAIAPSLTRTPLAKALLANDQTAEKIAGLHPMQRLGTPEDMASLAVFLLSRESGWMTGQVIGVDGGRSTLRTKG